MIGVMIVPTGLGAEIGGHAGDANPAAKLIASLCDKLITHPNVVNASDINEMTENTLYVEGSILDKFLRGETYLEEVNQNRVLVVTNAPVPPEVVNSVNAAKATIGLDAEIVELETPLRMKGWVDENGANGSVEGWRELLEQVQRYEFDALAITSGIEVDDDVKKNYLSHGGINPWGRVEAMASRLIASALSKPVAHAPDPDVPGDFLYRFQEVVDPRLAAEMVSVSYIHCILKGLHRAPRLSAEQGLSVDDVDFMVSPYGCYGPPHKACEEAEIPIIVVRENAVHVPSKTWSGDIEVENYWEAAGVIACMRAGVHRDSVRRPLESVKVSISTGDKRV